MTLWYLARATGFTSLIAFTLSVVLGAGGSDSGLPRRTSPELVARVLDQRILRQLAHRSAALVGLGTLGVHAILILLDSYASVSLTGALIPFAAGYAPFAVGLGTLAVYVFVMVALSGLGRGSMASSTRGARRWRSLHALAYLGWALALTHGILAGTDTGTLWSTAVYIICGVTVPLALWRRTGRAVEHTDDPLTRSRHRVHTGTSLTGAPR